MRGGGSLDGKMKEEGLWVGLSDRNTRSKEGG